MFWCFQFVLIALCALVYGAEENESVKQKRGLHLHLGLGSVGYSSPSVVHHHVVPSYYSAPVVHHHHVHSAPASVHHVHHHDYDSGYHHYY